MMYLTNIHLNATGVNPNMRAIDPLQENTMTSITIQKPATVRVPRAAPIAADIAFRVLDTIGSFFKAHRAQRAAAARIAEANAVRRYADQVRPNDPRLASDLLAAADRHELG